MNQHLYKKGNRLTWTGFLLGLVFALLGAMTHPELNGTSNPLFVPSLSPFTVLFALGHLACVALIVWGAYLALKSKNRNPWWLLLVVPTLGGIGGMIFVVILFMLKDKSINSEPIKTPLN